MQFRGADGRSTAKLTTALPTTWSADDGRNVVWEVELPGKGVSGPIVVGERIIVTSSSGENQERLHVSAFDASSGSPLWQQEYQATGDTEVHRTTANAAPTPTSDGQRVFALFSSNEVLCHDLNGNLLWRRDLGQENEVSTRFGMASSPTVVGDVLVVQCENAGESFIEALDVQTGATRWHLDRPDEDNWASPLAIGDAGGSGPIAPDAVLIQSPAGLELRGAASGDLVWQFERSCENIPSTTVVEELDLFLLATKDGLAALRIGEGNGIEVVWQQSALKPGAASPVVVADRVYTLTRQPGVLTCGDLATGEVLWKKRLGGTFWATPVAVGSRLYCVNQDGQAFVVDLNGEGTILAENKFSDEVLASPAVSGEAIYFRGYTHLWKIAEGGALAREIATTEAPGETTRW